MNRRDRWRGQRMGSWGGLGSQAERNKTNAEKLIPNRGSLKHPIHGWADCFTLCVIRGAPRWSDGKIQRIVRATSRGFGPRFHGNKLADRSINLLESRSQPSEPQLISSENQVFLATRDIKLRRINFLPSEPAADVLRTWLSFHWLGSHEWERASN